MTRLDDFSLRCRFGLLIAPLLVPEDKILQIFAAKGQTSFIPEIDAAVT
jgi:hypothetical protein